MYKKKKHLFLLLALPLTSCNASFNLFDQSFLYDAFNKEEHYRIADGEKKNSSSHIFDKLVQVDEVDGRRLYDYECRCGYRMNYDVLKFSEVDGEMALSGIDYHVTGYYGSNDVTYQQRILYGSLFGCPDKYDGKAVTTIGEEAFHAGNIEKKLEVKGSFFPSSITTIKKNAFLNSDFLFLEANFPNVETVEDDAFSGSGVNKVVLGEKLSSLGSAFYDSDLTSFTLLPSAIEKIPSSCFLYARKLKEVNLPSTVKKLGYSSFAYCSSLKEIELPDGLEEIETSAFFGCTSLESVVIPASMKSIGYQAFAYVDEKAHTHPYPDSFKCFYYKGNEEGADTLFGDASSRAVTVAIYSEEEPSKEGTYWHYVDGKPTIYGEKEQ